MLGDIEEIWSGEVLLAYIVREDVEPERTTFVTSDEASLQLGFVVYPEHGAIARHAHLDTDRHVIGTAEMLLVRKGRCALDFYSRERQHVATRELSRGDVVMILAGGHGFRMLEDTVLLEVKQGPFAEGRDKERF